MFERLIIKEKIPSKKEQNLKVTKGKYNEIATMMNEILNIK